MYFRATFVNKMLTIFLIGRYISNNIVCTRPLWNNLHQARPKSKDWKAKKKSKIKLKITKDLILLISGIFSCALELD
jgi:hypothetical protein